VLLHDGEADHLTDLPRPQRTVFLEDLAAAHRSGGYPDLHDPRYELGPQHHHVRAAVVDALDELLPNP
jgi:hypothetical protein